MGKPLLLLLLLVLFGWEVGDASIDPEMDVGSLLEGPEGVFAGGTTGAFVWVGFGLTGAGAVVGLAGGLAGGAAVGFGLAG